MREGKYGSGTSEVDLNIPTELNQQMEKSKKYYCLRANSPVIVILLIKATNYEEQNICHTGC